MADGKRKPRSGLRQLHLWVTQETWDLLHVEMGSRATAGRMDSKSFIVTESLQFMLRERMRLTHFNLLDDEVERLRGVNPEATRGLVMERALDIYAMIVRNAGADADLLAVVDQAMSMYVASMDRREDTA